MSKLLALNSTSRSRGTTDDFWIDFNTSIPLPEMPGKYWAIALHKANLWFSFYNIQGSLYNNNQLTYSPDGGTTWKTITIPDGNYTYVQLNTVIQGLITANGDVGANISIVANFSALKFILTLVAPYRVDFAGSNLYKLLGFTAAQAAAPITVTTQGLLSANIQNDVNNIYINVNLVSESWENRNNSEVIYSFLPASPPGTNISVIPPVPIYLPVKADTKHIRTVHIYFKDDLGRRIDLNGEQTQILLHLERKDL